MKVLEIDQLELKKQLHYEPITGVFTRVKNNGRWKAGTIAGCKAHHSGYVQISIGHTLYRAHRLAWVYMYGSIPEGLTVDHENGIRSDNRLDNLRLANQSEQNQNMGLPSTNTSGHLNVYWRERYKKWEVQIQIDGKALSKGLYADKEEAIEVAKKAKQEHHKFNPTQREVA